MGLFERYCNQELYQLKLTTDSFPLPCSLRPALLEKYSEAAALRGSEPEMALADILGYLQKTDDFETSPWVAILTQTEAAGESATPSLEHTAILQWLGEALEIWQDEFPLEEDIAKPLGQLKPLLAARALIDTSFLQAGAHPLHQLLDTLQSRAVGWQSDLDRAGTALRQQVIDVVNNCHKQLEQPLSALTATCLQTCATLQRDQARSERMSQRMAETEQGKVRTAAAKQDAAQMINALLENHPLPDKIGELITGPWYSSAQLVLLKHGNTSDEWQSMCGTTEALLDSLQSLEEVPEERRQQLFKVVTHLPQDMRRRLISLQHDPEAVNEAISLVENAHLRILRKQSLTLTPVEPIAIEAAAQPDPNDDSICASDNWEQGHWFLIATPSEPNPQRLQLAAKIDSEQRLLFTNMAGARVADMDMQIFNSLMMDGRAQPLNSGASFSRALTAAAGILSQDSLEAYNASTPPRGRWH